MAISIIPGIPQFLFLQEAQPTATSQGQLWVKVSTNQLYQADVNLTWNAVVTSPTASAGASLALAETLTYAGDTTKTTTADLSTYDELMIVVQCAPSGALTANLNFNADAGNNYTWFAVTSTGTYSSGVNTSSIKIQDCGGGATATINTILYVQRVRQNANVYKGVCAVNPAQVTSGQAALISGDYHHNSDITSVTISASANNLTGFVSVYGVKK